MNLLTASLLLAQAAAPTQITPPADDARPPAIPPEQRQQLKPPPAPAPVPPRAQVRPDPAAQRRAVAVLRDRLASADPVDRAHAIEAIQRGLGADGAALILPRLRDPHPLVRYAAAMAAGDLRLRAAYPDLLRLANDPDPIVPAGALFALHRLGDTRLGAGLVALTRHDDPQVRGAAVTSLGLLGDPSALATVREARADADPAVKLQALEAMWRLGSTEARDALIAGTVSQYGDDQIFCLLALAANGSRAVVPHVEAKLTGDYSYINLAAANALGRLGDDGGYGVAAANLDSPDPRDRQQAALALGAIGRADVGPRVEPLLADPDPSVRLAAAQATLQAAR